MFRSSSTWAAFLAGFLKSSEITQNILGQDSKRSFPSLLFPGSQYALITKLATVINWNDYVYFAFAWLYVARLSCFQKSFPTIQLYSCFQWQWVNIRRTVSSLSVPLRDLEGFKFCFGSLSLVYNISIPTHCLKWNAAVQVSWSEKRWFVPNTFRIILHLIKFKSGHIWQKKSCTFEECQL